MKVLLTIVAVIAAAALAGCGSVAGRPGGSASLPSPPAPSPSGSPVSQVTDGDDGGSVLVKLGSTVEVVLHQQPGFASWENVASSDPSVLSSVVDTRATAVRGVKLAAFKALRAGHADITASSLQACTPEAPCSQTSRLYRVSVTVTG